MTVCCTGWSASNDIHKLFMSSAVLVRLKRIVESTSEDRRRHSDQFYGLANDIWW